MARLVACELPLFVCRCAPSDALAWSLYSGDYVDLGGLLAVVNPPGAATEVAPGTLQVAPEVLEELRLTELQVEQVELEEATVVTIGALGFL